MILLPGRINAAVDGGIVILSWDVSCKWRNHSLVTDEHFFPWLNSER